MPALTWYDALATQHPQMDQTHREFVDHLGLVEAALGAELAEMLTRYDAMVEHTVEHFGQEDRWMVATGYSPENCHSLQHRQVLQVLRDVRTQIASTGKTDIVAGLLPELVQWFEQHAKAADAGLAEHMMELGYDVLTQQFSKATAPAASSVQGCGSSSCSDKPADAVALLNCWVSTS